MVFEDSYLEYRIQVQNYELHKQYTAYGDLIYHNPRAKELNARVRPSISGYIQQLGNVMPDILNNLGRRFLRFNRFQFEIINSHLDLKENHQIGISFFSESYFLNEIVGNYLLITQSENDNEEKLTELVQIQPYLSIYSIKENE